MGNANLRLLFLGHNFNKMLPKTLAFYILSKPLNSPIWRSLSRNGIFLCVHHFLVQGTNIFPQVPACNWFFCIPVPSELQHYRLIRESQQGCNLFIMEFPHQSDSLCRNGESFSFHFSNIVYERNAIPGSNACSDSKDLKD